MRVANLSPAGISPPEVHLSLGVEVAAKVFRRVYSHPLHVSWVVLVHLGVVFLVCEDEPPGDRLVWLLINHHQFRGCQCLYAEAGSLVLVVRADVGEEGVSPQCHVVGLDDVTLTVRPVILHQLER